MAQTNERVKPEQTPDQRDNRKEACKTYVEQTKLLVTLATAFLIPPAAVQVLAHCARVSLFVTSELLFVSSILAGYVVFASLAGSQDKGEFDVYRPAVRYASLLQIALFLFGLVAFLMLVADCPPPPPKPR